jgi:3',5'-cyclic AMP phosphodiesterase CpdA
MKTVNILHVSDIHFGRHCLVPMVEAIEAEVATGEYDVVAFSGDLTQRAWTAQLTQSASLLTRAARHARVIVVPGHHDVEWWWSPLHVFGDSVINRKYRRFIGAELEPVLRVPGATFVGLNTAQGVNLRTLTKRPRDISIIGDLRWQQVERAHNEFSASPTSDARVIVMHHNLLRGDLSQRFGLRNPDRVSQWFGQIGVDLVLCGHDHQESIASFVHEKGETVVATAGTVSNRSRGGRPSSVNAISISASEIAVRTLIWPAPGGSLTEGKARVFARKGV